VHFFVNFDTILPKNTLGPKNPPILPQKYQNSGSCATKTSAASEWILRLNR
jgi:hypothetical protein